MASIKGLDPHQKPPEAIKSVYKYHEKLAPKAINIDPDIVDFARGLNDVQQTKINRVGVLTGYTWQTSYSRFHNQKSPTPEASNDVPIPVYEHEGLPGLHLVPALLSLGTQRDLLSRLMHGVLADKRHKSNVHLHYQVTYDATHGEEYIDQQIASNKLSSKNTSFFNISPDSSDLFMPINPDLHKPITISQFLHRKLRWLTLGGQYDWTAKAYPAEEPPAFPEDIATLIRDLFPDMRPEAAILNIYTPGDKLSMHRDVSEESDKGLVSISIGCDGLFVVGLEDRENNNIRHITIRVRSGDAIYMSGPSRFAWHGVPKIIPDSCPQWLRDWPAEPSSNSCEDSLSREYKAWRGWMSTKRINLNVRQIRE